MRCGKPLEKEEQEYCRDCSRQEVAYEQGRSVWVHREPVSRAIYKFKYKNRRYYGEIFAREMASLYGEQLKRWEITEIIPVPLHPARKRKRGYNQAEILAEELGKLVKIKVSTDVIYRIRNTKPQKILDDKGRYGNLKGAFAVTGKRKLKGNVLIVDDIYTTGNTIQRIAKMLKLAGAQKVYFLTISIGQGL